MASFRTCVSSSGHIALINEIFNWQDINLTFMITAHLGTLMAVIIYFWNDVKKFFLSGLVEVFKKEKTINSKLFLNI